MSKEMTEALAAYLGDDANRLSSLLLREDWKPSRAHIEGDRNTMIAAQNTALQIARAYELQRKQLVKSQEIEKAARYYYDHFLQDEADDMECCFSEDQHAAAKALRDSLLTDEQQGEQR